MEPITDANGHTTTNADQYCLKWSDFSLHVVEILTQLFRTQSMVDVTLCVDGKNIFAHRAVLCAYSSYFKSILSDVDDPHPVVILTEMTTEDVSSILEFLYCGELNVDAGRILSVLKVAESLQIRALTEVSNYLKNLSPSRDIVSSTDYPFKSGSIQLTTSNIIEMPVEMEMAVSSVEVTDSFQNVPEQETAPQRNSVNLGNKEALQVQLPIRDTQQFDHRVYCQNSTAEQGGINEFQEAGKCNESSAVENNVEKQVALDERKRRKRRENVRKDYSEDQLKSALADLRAGHYLKEAAATHKIPRSTLYVRARAAGIPIAITRQEHSSERMRAAVDAVEGGASLQQASSLFQIPKTVLWRRVHSSGGRQTIRQKQAYSLARRQAAVQALQNGLNLSKASDQFQIPKTTLFRDKARLIETGKLPWNSLRRTHSRLSEAVTACQQGKMSQAIASATFQVPKTTIWRRLKKKQQSSGVGESVTAISQIQEQVSFTFCEENNQIPIAYIVDGTGAEFSGEPIII